MADCRLGRPLVEFVPIVPLRELTRFDLPRYSCTMSNLVGVCDLAATALPLFWTYYRICGLVADCAGCRRARPAPGHLIGAFTENASYLERP